MKHEVIGVRFQAVGKKYYFNPEGVSYDLFDHVVVETIRGIECGEVIQANTFLESEALIDDLKPIIRMATDQDLKRLKENNQKTSEVLKITEELVEKNELNMRLLNAHYTLEKDRLTIEYTAPEWVDFRSLVKDLAGTFKTRIDLRQMGPRDGAKYLGGIGPCGLLLCCNTFLGEFDSVSIKMAKNQNLALNPANISGLCGKLLCCLKYEDEMYTDARVGLPKEQSKVETKDGIGTVLSNNILERKVRVYVETKGIQKIHVDDLVVIEAYE
jgi:cell fate regulator YaaT (PSP1 superfamily)